MCENTHTERVASHIIADMERVKNVENLAEIVSCLWCDVRIGLAYHVSERVCVKCFRRLRSENVPDTKIFGRDENPGGGEGLPLNS